MKLRTAAPLVGLALVAGSLPLTLSPAAAAVQPRVIDQGNWCSDDSDVPPCVSAASVNGTPVASGDATWTVDAVQAVGAGPGPVSTDVLWNVGTKNGSEDLGASALGDHWVVTIDTGTVVPRVSSQDADNVTVTRTADGDGTYHVRIAGDPVTFTGYNNNDCDQSHTPWTCSSVATTEAKALFAGDITDYGSWTDVAQRNAMYGMDFTSNIAATTVPPSIQPDSSTGEQELFIELANQHFHPDGSSVFKGFVHIRIPNAFLKNAYGVDDPSTMTTTSLDATIGSGTTSVTQEGGADAMHVDVTGITFSERRLRIHRGVITPTRPSGLHAHRGAVHHGKVSFHRAAARGSTITGYVVSCTKAGHRTRSATGKSSPIVVRGLARNVGYSCRVRAKSKAGKGGWSAAVHLRAHP